MPVIPSCQSTPSARAIPPNWPNWLLILPQERRNIRQIRTQVRCRLLGERAAYWAVARERKSCRKSGAQKSHVEPPPRGGGKMTAEIAIINRQAVTLAADSAITIGRERVWKHANKIFSLGPRNDIGIMIYNAGDFLGIPWEVVVKEFREHSSERDFPTLSECSDEFGTFLRVHVGNRSHLKEYSIASVILDILETINAEINYRNAAQLATEVARHINDYSTTIQTLGAINECLSEQDFTSRYESTIKSMSRDVFKNKVSDAVFAQLVAFIYKVVTRQYTSDYSTGIVFAGFGRKEMLPCLRES